MARPMTKIPDPRYLAECFMLHPQTQALTWKRRPEHHFSSPRGQSAWNTRFAGTAPAVTNGYVLLDQQRLRAEHVVHALRTGSYPVEPPPTHRYQPPQLDPEYLDDALDYDHAAGTLMWKHRPANHFRSTKLASTWNGTHAGTYLTHTEGTERIRFARRTSYQVQEVICVLMGYPPKHAYHRPGTSLAWENFQ